MIKDELLNFSEKIETVLKKSLSHSGVKFDSVYKAMEYSLLGGGKRLRPFLLDAFYHISGGVGDDALNFAAAIEMIHTYSLIHDDLPCMDNDDLRRGKPSCHKAFSEEIALLAGDGLLTLAFETAAKTKNISSEKTLKAICVLAECAGGYGMIGGQVIDLESENKPVNLDTVIEMYKKKTGALLAAAAKIGTILAGGNEKLVIAAENFAYNLGIAFQIQDDILDVLGDSAVLGKNIGSDGANDKSTAVSLLGLQKAKEYVTVYTENAKKDLSVFGDKASVALQLADYLVDRNY